MHIDTVPGRVMLAGSEEQIMVEWNGPFGPNFAEFRVDGNRARLSKIAVAQTGKDTPAQVGETELEKVPLQFRLILKGAGYELREPGEVLD